LIEKKNSSPNTAALKDTNKMAIMITLNRNQGEASSRQICKAITHNCCHIVNGGSVAGGGVGWGGCY